MPRYIIITLFKINDKEEILKATRYKRHKGRKECGSLSKQLRRWPGNILRVMRKETVD